MFVHPGDAGLVALEFLQENLARHLRATHARDHDRALLTANSRERFARHLDDFVEVARHELEHAEHFAEALQILLGSGAGTALRERLRRFCVLPFQDVEATFGFDRVGAFFFLFLVFVLLDRRAREVDLRGFRHFVGGIEIADQQVVQAPFFGDVGVGFQDVFDRTGVIGQRGQNVADAFFDALRNGDFAFARQQFDRTHFTHVHAHRVGRATGFGLHRRQRSRSFFGGQFVGGAFAARQQVVGIRSHLVNGDPHVVDHADDVFDLIRIGDVVGQVIVDLGVSQESLLLTLGNQLFQTGLLLRGISAHETSAIGMVTRTGSRRITRT